MVHNNPLATGGLEPEPELSLVGGVVKPPLRQKLYTLPGSSADMPFCVSFGDDAYQAWEMGTEEKGGRPVQHYYDLGSFQNSPSRTRMRHSAC